MAFRDKRSICIQTQKSLLLWADAYLSSLDLNRPHHRLMVFVNYSSVIFSLQWCSVTSTSSGLGYSIQSFICFVINTLIVCIVDWALVKLTGASLFPSFALPRTRHFPPFPREEPMSVPSMLTSIWQSLSVDLAVELDQIALRGISTFYSS